MQTLQQIKERIEALQKELAVFETKRAILRRSHLEMMTYAWYDGQEIDHDKTPTELPNLESLQNEIQARVIVLDFTNRAINAMEILTGMISNDYASHFNDVMYEVNDSKEYVLEVLRKIRNMFQPAGEACDMWVGFTDSEKAALQQLLAAADKASEQDDAYGLRDALQNIFQQQSPILKRQAEERLPALKMEREQLKAFLQNVSVDEFVAKCGVPFWIEVSGIERLFVGKQAFPVPNVYARVFALKRVTKLDDGFHYKRIYDGSDEPSERRIFGFESREQFESFQKEYESSVQKEDDVKWAKYTINDIDEEFCYFGLNELFPQWKRALEKALAILENKPDDLNYIPRCKELLELPVVELRKVPYKGVKP